MGWSSFSDVRRRSCARRFSYGVPVSYTRSIDCPKEQLHRILCRCNWTTILEWESEWLFAVRIGTWFFWLQFEIKFLADRQVICTITQDRSSCPDIRMLTKRGSFFLSSFLCRFEDRENRRRSRHWVYWCWSTQCNRRFSRKSIWMLIEKGTS